MTRTRIKICGITTKADALMASRAGADAIGMILHAKGSPREIETTLALEIARALPPFIARVGVFQDATAPYIARCARSIPLDYVQLHGNESIDFVRALQSFRVIKSVRIEQLAEWVQVDLPNLEAILVDSSKGGSGVEQDWDVLSDQLRKLEPVTPILVAGGLKAENVADVVKKIRPFAVDVASGVESEPGVKSPERVESFVRAVGLTYQD